MTAQQCRPSWALTLAGLGLAAAPPLPYWSGRRVHRIRDDELELPEHLPRGIDAERARVLLLPLTDREAGLLLGISRQRAWQLRQRLAGLTEDLR
jgi:hypothetical protein